MSKPAVKKKLSSSRKLQQKQFNEFEARKAASRIKDNDYDNRTSSLWEMENYDPYQAFVVKHKKCHILHVFVSHGTNITKGWLYDLLDTPDPYLLLSVPHTPNTKKKTRTIDNCMNPVWEQSFQFYIDPAGDLNLELSLMDANYTLDTEMGKFILPLNTIKMDTEIETSASFPNESKVFLKLKIREDTAPEDMRFSLALSHEERDFLSMRRDNVMNAMRRLLGDDEGPRQANEVPVIGVLGSGGGFRAMTGMSGVCHALHDEGLTDCIMYMAGLSGSSWYISHLYSHPDFPTKSPGELKCELRSAVAKTWSDMISSSALVRYSIDVLAKMKGGQPVSLTDMFGHWIGNMLLQDNSSTLSEQRRCLAHGASPLPLYTCVHVKANVSARVFQDWFEFSPYEIGIAKYGTFMRSEHFGSKFYVGKILQKFPEPPLHFLQGIWGSAFCVLFTRLKSMQCEKPGDDEEEEDEFYDLEYNEDFTISGHDDECFESGSSEEEIEMFSADESSPVASTNCSRKNSVSEDSQLQNNDTEDSNTTEAPSRGNNAWQERQRSVREAKEEKRMTFWQSTLDSIYSKLFKTRFLRAGLVFNPLRGLNMSTAFPFKPMSPTTPEDDEDFLGFYEPTECSAKKVYVVDSGLTLNLPYPLLLRPQRGVNLYLSFDFTQRESDDEMPFNEILRAETWARLNQVSFPPVSSLVEIYKNEPIREWYLFEDPNDNSCPVILHFVILNKEFRNFKAPGVPRSTDEEKEFGNFDVFSDPQKSYRTYKLWYSTLEFDRLSQLMEFNVRMAVPQIKQQILQALARKRQTQRKNIGSIIEDK